MKRRNAILAAVIGIAIVAAAAGGILLMNSGTNTANASSEGSNDIRPTGPAGSVSSAVVSTAQMNVSNASALAQLRAEFNASPERSGIPDLLMKVAVTNNRDSNVTLNGTGFVAVLENDTSARAMNNASWTIEPNVTVFPVLGFVTNGSEVLSVSYDNSSISFSVTMTPQGTDEDLPDMVTARAPEGNMTPVDNLTFTNLAAWNITLGADSPIPLRFSNGSMVLALMTATNNNSSNVSLKATDFWIDTGNGTWVQGDEGRHNNLPSQLANNTTVPFLLGFRLADNMTANGSVFYWPEQGTQMAEVPLRMGNLTNSTTGLALKAMWDTERMNGNRTISNDTAIMSNGTNGTVLHIQLMAFGDNASASNISDTRVWTLRNGSMNVTPEVNGTDLNLTIELQKDDGVTLISYQDGNETKYVWLRPLVPRT